MIIKRAEFITSLDALKPFEAQGLPEIAMAGKSNVGKSSLINSLTGNGKLARTSSEPGKTRLINLYRVNESCLFVDLPGYGFAKAPQSEKKRWARMIEGYLSGSENLKHVLQLVDIRHEPTRDDVTMVEYLRYYSLPFTVVATKADKLSRAQMQKQIHLICRTIAVQPWEVIPYSSENGQGKDKLLEKIKQVLAPETPAE
ncbi:MAG: ribosome biogenesis GTP-binding protein YihA/YsxC [Clostridia bacterium]|nr:ribosome biogenesis GTP-binding protein YihA/YsxC [Clostridia bacterium]